MRISDLIKDLEEVKSEHGDLPVVCYFDAEWYVDHLEVTWLEKVDGWAPLNKIDSPRNLDDFLGVLVLPGREDITVSEWES